MGLRVIGFQTLSICCRDVSVFFKSLNSYLIFIQCIHSTLNVLAGVAAVVLSVENIYVFMFPSPVTLVAVGLEVLGAFETQLDIVLSDGTVDTRTVYIFSSLLF